jgi:hypothetical protein
MDTPGPLSRDDANTYAPETVKSDIPRESFLLGNAVFAQFTKNNCNCLHLQVCNATPQRGTFPEISHSQALLGALVSVLKIILVHKIN